MKTLSLVVVVVAALSVAPLTAQEKPTTPEKPAEKRNPPVSAGPEGFTVQNEAGDYRLQLRAYAHFDGRFFSGDEGALAIDTFVVRRMRPILQGSLGRYVDFNLMTDFGGGAAVIQDAWVDFKPSAKVKVRAGKFKSPVGLERLQSATAIHFVERAFPTAVVPNRDLGLQVHGDLAGGIVSYQAAIMNGAPDGGSVDGDVNDGKDLEGRIFFSPFRRGNSVWKELGFGISGTTGKQSGPLAAYRSGGQISIISLVTGITADGTRTRYSPQLSFYAGPFGLLGEYAQSESRVRRAADGRQFDFEAKAWQASAVFAVAGGKPSFAGLRPTKPFDPAQGQWGALELAARVHGLEIDRSTVDAGLIDAARSPRKVVAWTAGVNWHLTRNLKQVVNYEHASFDGGGAAGRDRDSEDVVFIRTQISF
jgi:phosphate-selective porin OprO/OprP